MLLGLMVYVFARDRSLKGSPMQTWPGWWVSDWSTCNICKEAVDVRNTTVAKRSA